MENGRESTQLLSSGFEEEWIVKVDGKEFILNETEHEIIKKASMEGFRGIIFFEKKDISIAHISSMDLNYRGPNKSDKKLRYQEITDKDGKITAYRVIE